MNRIVEKFAQLKSAGKKGLVVYIGAGDPHLKNGLNIAFGKVTCKPVAEALGYKYVPADAVM